MGVLFEGTGGLDFGEHVLQTEEVLAAVDELVEVSVDLGAGGADQVLFKARVVTRDRGGEGYGVHVDLAVVGDRDTVLVCLQC